MKMNLSMDFLRPIFGTLKKYKAMLPSVTITVVGLLLLLPTMLLGSKVKGKMEESVRTAGRVQSILRNVPSKYETQQIKQVMDGLENETKEIEKLATQSSQRNLVTYDYQIFPEPKDQSSQIYVVFGEKYRKGIEGLIQQINALDAPNDAEIRRTGGNKPAGIYGGGAKHQDVDAQDPMIDALCLSRAQEASVYMNPSAFAWYGFWKDYDFTGRNQALEDCWDSQVAFWIYEDIVDTIKKMNGSVSTVLSAPVKRLLGVSFTGPVTAGSGDRNRGDYYDRTGMSGRDIPNYITPLQMSNFIGDSPTGRKSNDETDIIHFAVSVILQNRFVLPFMKELCSEKAHVFYPSVFKPEFIKEGEPVDSRHNQITVLKSDIQIIDKTNSDHELYRYGRGAVVRLDLICEYQFDRSGYDSIKPDTIKKRLDQQTEEQQQDQQAPGVMPGI